MEENFSMPYKVIHFRDGHDPFELGCSSINRALEVAQIQLDTHSKPEDRVGSLRGQGLVIYYEGQKVAGQVEVLIGSGNNYQRIGG